MRVLVGCEFSQTVTKEFRKKGHEAFSCDLLPTDGNKEWHIQGDVRDILSDGWDLGIFHPDCTYLTGAGEWAFSDVPTIKGKPRKIKSGTLIGEARRRARIEALSFVLELMNAPIDKINVENPVGVIGTKIRRADQYIQPYEYGHDASKKTGLWLKNLSLLIPTKYIEPRLVCCNETLPDSVGRHGCPNCCGENIARPRWGNQTNSGQNNIGPSADRWKVRSKFYQGRAQAMADQWG